MAWARARLVALMVERTSSLVGDRHGDQRDLRPLVDAGQLQPGHVLVDPAEDGDVAGVLAHVVLRLGVAPSRVPGRR